MVGFTKENMVCDHCKHKLTDHWSGGCGQKHNNKFIIDCLCPSYFPVGEKYVARKCSKYNVEEAKLTVLRELGY